MAETLRTTWKDDQRGWQDFFDHPVQCECITVKQGEGEATNVPVINTYQKRRHGEVKGLAKSTAIKGERCGNYGGRQ